MAVHDFFCGRCGQVLVDIDVPVTIGARVGAPECCGLQTTPIPGIGRMDIGAVKGASFQSFTTTDGRGQPVFVDSFHKLRQIERDSEQAFRNGEGQPMVWRHASQSGSNRDAPTLSKDYYGGDAPTAEAKHRFGSTLRKSTEAPAGEYGPGVSDANASALGEGKA